jgi:hypothetical protein
MPGGVFLFPRALAWVTPAHASSGPRQGQGMAIEHDVLKFTDLAAQIEAWKERFVSEVGIAKYRRGAA